MNMQKGTSAARSLRETTPPNRPAVSVSTIVPIWNEVECLPHALERIHGFLERRFDDFEMIIVESGSTDGSGPLCDAFAQARERATVVHEGARKGFGSALRTGFLRASKDVVWVVTVDLPFPLETIVEALPLLETHDCVLSYREPDGRSVFRRVQSFVFYCVVRMLIGLRVRHVNSSFKLYKRESIQSLDLRSDGWLIDAEIVYNLDRRGLKYEEIPVPSIERVAGRSSVGLTTPFSLLRDVVKFSIENRTTRSRSDPK